MPIWWDESDRVTFNASPRISKSRAAIERAQESASKKKTTVHGRYFIAEPVVTDGGAMPTRDEWLEEQARKKGNIKPVSKFGGSSGDGKFLQGRK